MGQVSILYCELCKAEIKPATYSRPNESGEIHYSMVLRKHEGTVYGTEIEICEKCHGKMETWIAGKADSAAEAWKTAPPTAVSVKMPTI
jgi:hypothetical protein